MISRHTAPNNDSIKNELFRIDTFIQNIIILSYIVMNSFNDVLRETKQQICKR